MEKIFSIGEVSKITDISVQTLRNYSNMGLVTPEKTDEKTGYRYYTINQLHLLDKIKYLRELDFSIPQISDAISAQNNVELTNFFSSQTEKIRREIDRLRTAGEILRLYQNTFEHQKTFMRVGTPYIRTLPERTVLSVPYSESSGPEDSEIKLTSIRHSVFGKKLAYYRQFGYELNRAQFLEGSFAPESEFMAIIKKPGTVPPELSKYIKTYPAGEYLCFFDTKEFDKFSRPSFADKEAVSLVLAEEYSENLNEYGNTVCEYQIYI